MSELIIIEYQNKEDAYAARKLLIQMQSQHKADVADAVIATIDTDGHIKLDQMVNQWTVNAKGGGLIGLLYGAMFMHPILGAAFGAGAIALSNAVSDYGISDKFMTDTAEILQPGQSALFVMLRNMPTDGLLSAVAANTGKVIRAKLDSQSVEHLRHTDNTNSNLPAV